MRGWPEANGSGITTLPDVIVKGRNITVSWPDNHEEGRYTRAPLESSVSGRGIIAKAGIR